MYKQVLSEAPWIDVSVRGEREEIFVNLLTAPFEGCWPAEPKAIRGLAYRDAEHIVATAAASTVRDLDALQRGWSLLEWSDTSTCRWAPGSRSSAWRGAARSPALSAAIGTSGATTGCATKET